MKGKNPTRKQKIMIKENKLNPDNWVVLKAVSYTHLDVYKRQG